MNLQFDHVIHYVDDAHDIMNEFQNKGFHTVYGGRHEKRGSYNTLLHFGLSYIEFLGIDDKELFDQVGAKDVAYSPFSSIARDRFSEGFAKMCIRSNNLDQLAKHFKEKGLKTNGPVPLSRKRPDGKLLEWSLLFVGEEQSELPLPFFIDWHETDEERETGLREANVIGSHKDGAFAVESITMSVHDAKETASKWSEWFDLKQIGNYVDQALQAKIYMLELSGGNVQFAEPIGAGIVKETLDKRGERPFLLTLDGSSEQEYFNIRNGYYLFNGGKKHA
ncbi:VOC family protein [Bacillus sp. JCM 19041]|uniref:VOC family protein n=1 Tax=Bacillus sp. JCM 19041 TaxID=1460637 RepID=UPI0006D1C752